jgi:hypothetical protein
MSKLKELKYFTLVLLLFGFIAAGSLSSCRDQKKEEKTEEQAVHPESEEHPTEEAGAAKDGEEHPAKAGDEHPSKAGEEHPAKDSVSG